MQAYEHCSQVAKREAKNFYYAFLALPAHKRNAMCAMYAFMRRADDIADDETMSIEDRRGLMCRWTNAFHQGQHLSNDDDAVFTAVRDTQQRFGISDELLDELVAGTVMDLQEEPPEGVNRMEVSGRVFDVYATIESLDRYCYLVASVVGLVTIRIFGFKGEHADEHAIAMGKAFQYTNILRDVREDAERGRIYLPLDLLGQHGAVVEDVLEAATRHEPNAKLLAAMQALAARAESFYAADRSLIAAIEQDSRGAMRTLIDIYHALLHRIEHVHLQVFRKRVRVSTARKVGLLLRGMLLRSYT
ncbi:phytoene/squalene synthase family protein [Terriglobus sp.]|uniref:phytoene/squalene synthase family protein n=1 Tax=Terriglobus sp. TaxID=1889013 RepID=UPI003B00654A